MAESESRVNNHYVQEAYLGLWESSPGKIFMYQRLVSHESVPNWTERQIGGIGYRRFLYARPFSDNRMDEIEHWFANNFESPAWASIQRVVNDDRLAPEDWSRLIKFLVLHDVRTPARFLEHLESLTKFADNDLPKILLNATKEIEVMPNRAIMPVNNFHAFPLKVTTTIKDEDEFGEIKVEIAPGRSSWLSTIEHQLKSTAKVLHEHKWRIMQPADGMSWFTTDNPVIRLNFNSPNKFNFKGGWGSKGTEIIMPLSPKYMLYTKVGHYPPARNSQFSSEQTRILRSLIAKHAHRYVYSNIADDDVANFIPRVVSQQQYKSESEQWERYHEDQTESEKYFFDK